MVVIKQILFLWDVITCILVDMYSSFQEKQDDGSDRLLCNIVRIYQIK